MIKHFFTSFDNALGGKSSYLFLEDENKLIAFYPVPKNANSSIKLFLMMHLGYHFNENDFSTKPEYELIKDKKKFESPKNSRWGIFS